VQRAGGREELASNCKILSNTLEAFEPSTNAQKHTGTAQSEKETQARGEKGVASMSTANLAQSIAKLTTMKLKQRRA
jgi:hypothetical protein